MGAARSRRVILAAITGVLVLAVGFLGGVAGSSVTSPQNFAGTAAPATTPTASAAPAPQTTAPAPTGSVESAASTLVPSVVCGAGAAEAVGVVAGAAVPVKF